jgi:hypothetical protein
LSIKSGQLLNRVNLNAAFVSKLDDNNILGSLTTQGDIQGINITATSALSGASLAITGNVAVGGTIGVDGLLTAALGVEIPAGQNYTVGGIPLSAAFFGLGNVTNESKETMFTSPAFTGTPTAPTAAVGTNSTQIATTAYVKSQGYITQLADDPSPQLSANLDVNGKSITTGLVNGNVTIAANGTGKVNITTDALFDNKVMLGSSTTYLEKDAVLNRITTPNSMATSSDLLLSTDAGRIYLGASSDAIIARGGTNSVQIGDGTSTGNLLVPNGYLSLNTVDTSEALNVGGGISVDGSISYSDESRYLLSTGTNTGLYWDTTTDKFSIIGAGSSIISFDTTDQSISSSGDMAVGGKLTASSALINNTGLRVQTGLGGDGGWANSIIVENTALDVTGEASIAFRNAGIDGTGTNYWFAGLNGGTSLDFVYDTSFTSSPKMSITDTGDLSIAGGLSTVGDIYVGEHMVWHYGNLQIEPIEVFYEEFTATEGQTLFTLTQGSYPLGMNLLTVYIWGAKQPPNGFTETTTTSFTLAEGVPAGTKVLAEWFEVSPNLKGEKGDPPEHEWLGTELRFRMPDGIWGSYTNLKGDTGAKPEHEWLGTELRFQNADDSWGEYVNLKGEQGIQGVAATLSLGTISFIEPSEAGYVTNIGNANDAIFDIGIPKGSTVALHGTPVTTLLPNQSPTISNSGANGNSILQFGLPRAPQVSVGTVTTLLNSQPATVTNTGTNGDVVLNFGLPAGKGITNIVDNLNGTVTMYYGESLSSVVSMTLAVDAEDVSYSNTVSGLTATSVQAAIDEIDGILDSLSADAVDIVYDNTGSGMTAVNVQAAIDEHVDNTDVHLTQADKDKLDQYPDSPPVIPVSNWLELADVLEDTSTYIKRILPLNVITVPNNVSVQPYGNTILCGDLEIWFQNDPTLEFYDDGTDYAELTAYAPHRLIFHNSASNGDATIQFTNSSVNSGFNLWVSSVILDNGDFTFTADYNKPNIQYETLSTTLANSVTGIENISERATVNSNFIAEASTTLKGLMSPEDKTKLDGFQPILLKQGSTYTTAELVEGQIGFLYD